MGVPPGAWVLGGKVVVVLPGTSGGVPTGTDRYILGEDVIYIFYTR